MDIKNKTLDRFIFFLTTIVVYAIIIGTPYLLVSIYFCEINIYKWNDFLRGFYCGIETLFIPFFIKALDSQYKKI